MFEVGPGDLIPQEVKEFGNFIENKVNNFIESTNDVLSSITDFLGSNLQGDDSYKTKSTDQFTSENGGGNENATSELPDEVKSENIDDLLSIRPAPGSLTFTPLNFAKSAKDVTKIIKMSSDKNNEGQTNNNNLNQGAEPSSERPKYDTIILNINDGKGGSYGINSTENQGNNPISYKNINSEQYDSILKVHNNHHW